MFQLIPKDTSSLQDVLGDVGQPHRGEPVLWVDLFADYRDVDKKIDEIRRIERQGDERHPRHPDQTEPDIHNPFRPGRTFTSSPRSSMMFWDFINASGARLVMYRITDPPPAAGELARIILMQSQELQKAVSLMQKTAIYSPIAWRSIVWRMKRIWYASRPLPGCLNMRKTPINLIKVERIAGVLERATDKAEDVANVLETVVLKEHLSSMNLGQQENW